LPVDLGPGPWDRDVVAWGVCDIGVVVQFLLFIRFPFLLLMQAFLGVVSEPLHKCNSTQDPVVIVVVEGFEVGVGECGFGRVIVSARCDVQM